MITTALLALIAAAVFTQPNAQRFFAAAVFVVLTLCHEVFFSSLDGLAYYASAALLDLAIIILISGIAPISQMVITMHRICMASILVNFAGWVVWFNYMSPVAYDSLFIVIYAWTLITLIKRNGDDVGGYTMGGWHSCFRFNHRASILGYSDSKGQA